MSRRSTTPATQRIERRARVNGTLRAAALLAALTAGLAGTARTRADVIGLAQLDLANMPQEYGKPGVDRSIDGNPLSIGGRSFDKGIGGHALSSVIIDLDGKANRFTAFVGVDDEVKGDDRAKRFPIDFRVLVDGKPAFKSGPIKVGDAAKAVDVDLTGAKTLVLYARPAGPGIDFTHADWADAKIDFGGAKPRTVPPAVEEKITLTPKPPATPRINGAKVVGVRPGRPLLYQVAATGQRPMKYAAENLPAGFTLDEGTGGITGKETAAGSHKVKVRATNALGTAETVIRIEVGDAIALTPPMGWNSWNCFADDVSDAKVRAAVDTFVASGLTQHGWTYINIDDCWQVREREPAEKRRSADGRVLTNAKFPDMRALADYIHANGLRAGLYSSPGPATCAGFEGSYKHEADDARQYAEWGYDYLKYDWCAYQRVAEQIRRQPNRPSEHDVLQHPYDVMRDELVKQDRDIVYSLCQYGWGDVWTWGASAGGQCWRTTGDIEDSWSSMSGIGFSQAGHEKYAKPGHWNDPDMLVVGKVGWGPKLHATRLTPSEQYTHVSLWSLLASPLLIGCDLTQLDDFTLGLLTNDEVLAVNQDALGKQAGRIAANDDDTEIWAKDLEDGSKAVGLFNRSEVPLKVTVKWSQLGLAGKQTVRDLWRQAAAGESDDSFTADVSRHGAVLVKVSPAK